MKHITATMCALALVAILSATVAAQSQPTRLGLWAQAQGRTAAGAAIGCNVRPPYSTYCWQHIVDASGNIVAVRHRYQLADGRISVHTTKPTTPAACRVSPGAAGYTHTRQP